MRRVAVTGIGVVSPLGIGLEATWQAAVSGRSGVGPIDTFDVSEYPARFAALVRDFDPSGVLDPKEARRLARFQQFAMVAAEEALADSGLRITDGNARRVGVIVGSGIGGLGTMEEQSAVLAERGPSRVSPFLVPMMIVDLAAGHISIRHGAKGINYAPVAACATGNNAIGEAFEVIRRGSADAVISGSFDAGVTPLGLAGFCAARALSTRNDDPAAASRPFDTGRDGFVMGEGGAILVLEEWEHALARGARIRAEVVGYGASADAFHVTAPAPDGEGAAQAMREALDVAGIAPGDVGHINAHGTSTPAGDAAEAAAIRAVFGEPGPAVSSTKSVHGHLLGGAASLEGAITVRAIEEGLIPPTVNLVDIDPECELDHVRGTARECRIDFACSNSFGFGGHNTAVVFARADR